MTTNYKLEVKIWTHSHFEVVILSKSHNLTMEPVLDLLRAMQNLMDPQLVFPSETFATGRTLVRYE